MVRAAVGVWAMAVCLAVGPAAPQAAELSGYGKLGLTVQRDGGGYGTATFTCESPERADRLLSKLRADLTWDRLLGIREVKLPGGTPALALQGYGVLVLARKGSAVYGVSAPSPAASEAALKRLALSGKQVRFVPAKRHPMALDFYDLRPVSMYYLSMNVRDLEKGWKRYDRGVLGRTADFWKPFGFGYSRFHPYFGGDELADGAAHFFPMDYCVGQAVARDAVVMSHIGSHWAPWWMRNRFPADVIQWDPYAISGWNPAEAMGGTFLSQFASEEAFGYARRFTTRTQDRLKAAAGDHLGCFRVVGGGHPGDEMGLHHLSTEFMDYDEAGQEAFRRWLREVRKLDLPALGKRWYDDPARYRTWGEVRLPSNFESFGGFGQGTLELLQGWQWRPDSEKAEEEGWYHSAYSPGEEWTPVDLAPSLKQLFLFGSERDKELRGAKSTVCWFRKEFGASAWLEKNQGRQVYVVAQVGDPQTQPVEVFLNGSYLGPIKPKTVWCGPIAFKATALVKPGRNVLCLKVQGGLIRGPVFLTTEEPKRYPYLGRLGNARWVDLRDWHAQKLIRGWLREARPARERDLDTPFMFAPGTCRDFWDHFLELKREVGISSLQHTGGGSSYMPWWSGIGYVLGVYKSSEEGGTIADPVALSRELAWMLLDAHGHHNYYYDALDYLRLEEKSGWFTRNRRLLELFGKANWVKPPVAVLRAARSDRYFPYSALADDWDIGRSSLQAAHVQNVYVSEAEVAAGLADAYPVLWDAGTSVLDEALLAGIERYVRAGGTFVAVNVTGRHATLDADAWPIEELTGFKVIGERENMHVTVLPENPLLKRLAGMTFPGNGVAVNWMGVNHLSEGAVALEPKEGDGVVLARWEDGTAAVGMRRLGKGRVILLGSSFWRSMSDRAGTGVSLNGTVQTAFFNDLFAGLKIAKAADVDREDVWLRRMVTKNGLQEWVMAYNAGRGPVAGRTLTFPLARRPERVTDVVSGKPVEFTWEKGTVRVPSLDLERNAVRVFGVPRRCFLDSLEHWLGEKRRYETRPVVAKSPEAQRPLPAPTAVVMDTFRFRQAGPDARENLDWLREPIEGATWKDASYGFWDEMGYAPKGIGLYRRSFRAPAAWKDQRVLLAFASWDYPVFLEKATVFVNGTRVGEYQGHPWANLDVLEITSGLREGENTLGLLVEATEGRGGYIGQLVAYPLDRLEGAVELKSGWKLYSDNRKWAAAEMPFEGSGRHIETEVVLPREWKPGEVLLEFDVADKWVGLVVINDRIVSYNAFRHPYPNIAQVSLYPWVRPGEANRIELWPRTPEDTPRAKMVVKGVRVGRAAR